MEGKKREEMLDSSKKIFVGGLDPSVTNDDLKSFFSNYGTVKEACVLFDNNRGVSRCFGFVTFEEKETVELLVSNNKYSINGKRIDVKQAQPKSMQKTQNIRCQSAVDTVLGKHEADFHQSICVAIPSEKPSHLPCPPSASSLPPRRATLITS